MHKCKRITDALEKINKNMRSQRGMGSMPVYVGTRYQRGGGILDSLTHMAKPIATKLLAETVKTAPSVLGDIVLKRRTPTSALLHGLKRVGINTLKSALPGAVGSKRKRRRRAAAPVKKVRRGVN